MSLRMGFRPVLVCVALFAGSQVASAQIKVAVVNLQKAVFESAEIKKADAGMQAMFKPPQDKIDALMAEIQGIARNLQTNSGKLTPHRLFLRAIRTADNDGR